MNCCGKRFEKLVKEVFIWNIREENGRKIEENIKKLRYWCILWINMIYRIRVLEVKWFVRFLRLVTKIEVDTQIEAMHIFWGVLNFVQQVSGFIPKLICDMFCLFYAWYLWKLWSFCHICSYTIAWKVVIFTYHNIIGILILVSRWNVTLIV